MKIFSTILMISSAFCAISCGGAQTKSPTAPTTPPPPQKYTFSADSAFAYVAAQTAFGPRVPGTLAAAQCAQWLQDKLIALGADSVKAQKTTVTAYNGDKLPIYNITAQLFPALPNRVLLLAHWDSRPWADHDKDKTARRAPIDGANDGASGVGVILELVRLLSQEQSPHIGIDILFTDAEDYGCHRDDEKGDDSGMSWCLGTQYWLQHPTLDLSKIKYAILLDMVGGKDAVFHREYYSTTSHPQIVDRVWKAARQAGEGERFSNDLGGAVLDDHIFFIMSGIPAIDIIESMHPDTDSFNPTWHTLQDNINNIDPSTLSSVGRTLIQLLQ